MTSPSAWKAGLSAPSDCMSVPGRMYSSRSRIGSPLTSRTVRIERSNRPASHAAAARRWLSTAKASTSSREKPYSVAMMSALMPCGTK